MTRVAARTHPNTPEYRSRPHVLTLNIPRSYPVAFEISKLLDCGLDKESLAILVSLCENGVSPEALATVVQELRREAKTLWN
jgi:mitotic-spindle organizing protein 1